MKSLLQSTLISLVMLLAVAAADAPPVAISKIYDQQLGMVEAEFTSLVQAMPADKFDFAPAGETFNGVRTFGQQARHVATVIYLTSSTVLGEKSPVEGGENENGPASIKTKEDIVKYLKDAFAYAHKADATLTSGNLVEMVPSAFGTNKVPRASMAAVPVWHSMDHYGQMVIYARMNGVVPPASRR